MKNKLFKAYTLIYATLIILLPKVLTGDTLSTLQITQSIFNAIPNCLHYKIIGLCFWKNCSGSVCWIETTLKVDHYLPDAVVSIYRKENSNPWDFANTALDPVAQQIGQDQVKGLMGFNMGFGNENSSSPTEQNTHFKEADIIGNPTIVFFTHYSQVFLPSQATPFIPYYLSQADGYLWRSPLMEMLLYPLYMIPGVHVVGSLADNWGSVYPRTGFIDQPADTKAAAVIAQRAAEIVTRGSQPHVYKPLNTDDSCGDHCQTWEAIENDPNTQFQMVYPIEQDQCSAFGENDMASPQPWGQDAANLGNSNYAWVMWRHYQGCIPGHGIYMGSVDF